MTNRICRGPVLALLTVSAIALSACSGENPDQAPISPDRPSPEATQAIADWPAGTPDLREVVFDVTVTGDREDILPDGSSGDLVLGTDAMTAPVRLVFRDGVSATYRIPVNRLEILGVGSSLTCRDAAIGVPEGAGTNMTLAVEVEGASGKGPDAGSAQVRLSWLADGADSGTPAVGDCRGEAAWAAIDGAQTGGRSEEEEVAITALKVVGVAVGVVLVVALCSVGACPL